MPKRDNVRDERVCAQLERGIPAWRIARRYDLRTSEVYFLYKKTRGVTWTEARPKFKVSEPALDE